MEVEKLVPKGPGLKCNNYEEEEEDNEKNRNLKNSAKITKTTIKSCDNQNDINNMVG